MESEFRKLAKKITKDIGGNNTPDVFYGEYYLCHYLSELAKNYVIKYFKPTENEIRKYRMHSIAWLTKNPKIGKKRNPVKNNSFRVLILLFAEQHYLTYSKSKK